MRADSINQKLFGSFHQHKDAMLGTLVRRLPRWVTPNGITALRVLLVIPIYWLYMHGYVLSAVIIFGVALVTDLLDGILARHRGVESVIGKLFDPAADKILIITIFLMLAIGRIDDSLIYTLILLEVSLVFLAVIIGPVAQHFMQRKPKLGANNAGKAKMTLQSLAIILLLSSTEPIITTIASCVLWGAAIFAGISILLHLVLREPTTR